MTEALPKGTGRLTSFEAQLAHAGAARPSYGRAGDWPGFVSSSDEGSCREPRTDLPGAQLGQHHGLPVCDVDHRRVDEEGDHGEESVSRASQMTCRVHVHELASSMSQAERPPGAAVCAPIFRAVHPLLEFSTAEVLVQPLLVGGSRPVQPPRLVGDVVERVTIRCKRRTAVAQPPPRTRRKSRRGTDGAGLCSRNGSAGCGGE